MIFTNQDSVGPESNERTPVIDLGLARPWAVEWTLLILLGASVPGSARVPRKLLQNLGAGLGGVGGVGFSEHGFRP